MNKYTCILQIATENNLIADELNGVDSITALGSDGAGVKAFNPISFPWIIDRTTFIHQALAVDCGLIDCGQSFELIKIGVWTKWANM